MPVSAEEVVVEGIDQLVVPRVVRRPIDWRFVLTPIGMRVGAVLGATGAVINQVARRGFSGGLPGFLLNPLTGAAVGVVWAVGGQLILDQGGQILEDENRAMRQAVGSAAIGALAALAMTATGNVEHALPSTFLAASLAFIWERVGGGEIDFAFGETFIIFVIAYAFSAELVTWAVTAGEAAAEYPEIAVPTLFCSAALVASIALILFSRARPR